MATKKKARQKPAWERAYKGHVLWLGKSRLGKVTLAEKGHYTWQAAGRMGNSDDLEKAKKAVELAIAMADKQLDLFK
jgi:VCBS repeat-containing protein